VQSAKLHNAYPPNAKVWICPGKNRHFPVSSACMASLYAAPEGGKGRAAVPIEMIDSGPRLYWRRRHHGANRGSMEPYTDLSSRN